MQKVLITASSFSHILNFHLPYLRAFHESGWEVHVACGGTEAEIPWADSVYSLPMKKKISAPQNFLAAEMLRKLMRKEHFDLIVTHTSLSA